MDDYCLCLHLCLCLSPPPIHLCLCSLTFFMYILSPLNTVKVKVRKGQQCLTINMYFSLQFFPVCVPWPSPKFVLISQRNSGSLLRFQLWVTFKVEVWEDMERQDGSFNQLYLLSTMLLSLPCPVRTQHAHTCCLWWAAWQWSASHSSPLWNAMNRD